MMLRGEQAKSIYYTQAKQEIKLDWMRRAPTAVCKDYQ